VYGFDAGSSALAGACETAREVFPLIESAFFKKRLYLSAENKKCPPLYLISYGKSQKETSPQNFTAQAQEALALKSS
jgi:hypothetical protein